MKLRDALQQVLSPVPVGGRAVVGLPELRHAGYQGSARAWQEGLPRLAEELMEDDVIAVPLDENRLLCHRLAFTGTPLGDWAEQGVALAEDHLIEGLRQAGAAGTAAGVARAILADADRDVVLAEVAGPLWGWEMAARHFGWHAAAARVGAERAFWDSYQRRLGAEKIVSE